MTTSRHTQYGIQTVRPSRGQHAPRPLHHANILSSRRKALKVVDLRNILSKAEVSAPQKANKQDLITKILASEQALKAYRGIHDKNDGGEEEDELVSVLVWSLNVDG